MKSDKKTYKEEIAEVFRSLASPIRIGILILLAEKEHCACEFPSLLNISQPNSSRNLTILKNAGLIESYRDGQKNIYHIKNLKVKELIALAKELKVNKQ